MAFVTGYTVLHLPSWTPMHYSLPVDAIMLIFAGSAVVWLYDLIAARLAGRGTEAGPPLDQDSVGMG